MAIPVDETTKAICQGFDCSVGAHWPALAISSQRMEDNAERMVTI